ncbi:hypothetical protein BKA82DRAFT_29634 [Pisolithus tinctorius]|uniref:Uncharacterized protein n=1 Tax=Pisolithus tinctorius Marx 270 TaxID=870435 RepID=A0A0C3NYL2_PISTI|nr:hypothetical protein BKA82DRAFT_29634 [Pisolithus tinctorius]KIO00234.1 hypothetical protein M404DRAFT_29634 [Pisolithus tinctorius Marx 270]
MAQIFFNSLGTKATLALWTFVVIAHFSARAAKPSHSLVTVHFHFRISSIAPAGLLAFAGTAAINAIFTMSITSLYVAYAMPIFARFAFDNDFKPGPFNLGIFSLPIGIIAIAFMALGFMIIVPPPCDADHQHCEYELGNCRPWWCNGPVPSINDDKKDGTRGMYDDYASKEKVEQKPSLMEWPTGAPAGNIDLNSTNHMKAWN